MAVLKNLIVNGVTRVIGDLTAAKIIKQGGVSSLFLKADGSVDSTSYYHSGNKPSLSDLGAASADHTHSYLPLSGGTITGDLYINNNLYGPAIGNNPRNRYDSGLYFFNCNSSTISTYNFGLYQWNDEFQFTYRTSADNVFQGNVFTIQGSNGQVTFTNIPKVGSTLVSLVGHTHTTSEITGFPTSLPANGGNADTLDSLHLMTQISNWNTDSLSIFKSSENSISNAPTTDFTYGITLRFHRDYSTYHTDLVTSLYHDRLFFRRKTEEGYQTWRELIHSGNIGSQSVSYATSAGNAATVGSVAVSLIWFANKSTGYWKDLGYGKSNNLTLGSNNGDLNWRAENYCADLMFGNAIDTHGFLSIGYGHPIVSFAGSNNINASNDNPNWYFKLKGTSGTTYDLDCVPAATKLQTARTVWGQSFDGTANISGALTGVTDITAIGHTRIVKRLTIGEDLGNWNSSRAEIEQISAYGCETDYWMGSGQRDWCISTRSHAENSNLVFYAVDSGDSVTNILTLEKTGKVTIKDNTIWHAGNDGSGSGLDADTVDGEHSSAFAHIGAHNNLIASGNEFTFASSGFSGEIYINYRTAGGTNGNITDYLLGNGKGGILGTVIHSGNIGSQSVNYALSSPAAANYGGQGETTKIKIKINSATSWMLSFVVTIYQGYKSSKVMVSGYNYGSYHWYEPEAILLGDSNSNTSIPVYFGYDSDWNLWVGFDGGSYTGVSVSDVTNGYTLISSYKDLFTISNVSSLSTLQTTVTATNSVNYAASAGTSSYVTVSTNTSSSSRKILFHDGNAIYSNTTLTVVPSSGNVTSSGHFYANSDIRYKNIIEYYYSLSNKIAQLPIIKYKWTDREDDSIRIGSSALSVMNIIPELVSYDNNTDFYSLDYATLGAVAGISACREVETLKKRIQDLEQEIIFLKSKYNG